ncbi:MAG: SDR family oxidoreductase [Betaproteobacteria bacterium]|nr:SDR family oxidoreductase [Betaproteobacteria bacterium]
MIDLTGKVALISGASGGIGREVARVFVDCGSEVALSYHSREAPVKAVLDHARSLGRRARMDKVDTTDPVQARRWVEAVLAEFGKIDILVSCTGARLPEGFSLFVKQDPATWAPMINAQMTSFFYLCRPVIEHMLARKSGRVIALGSDGGKVGESGTAVANAGNAGLMGFAKSLAREVGRSGITANVVCPGPVEGPTLDALRSQGDSGARMVEEMIRRVPMKRLGTGRDIGNTMAFLASDEAAYITGQAISVSGGLVMN